MRRAICLLFAVLVATSVAAETRTRYLISPRRPVRAAGLGLLREITSVPAYQARAYTNVNVVAATLTESEAAALRSSGDVRFVDPVVPRYISGEPARTLAPTPSERLDVQNVPYGIDAIRARAVWPVTRGGGANINVAVVDTGIDYNHPDLKARYAGGYNVFNQTTDAFDDHSHGTHVAGTIAAIDNEFGVVGVAPEAKLWAVKVLDKGGAGSSETVIAGVDWVVGKKREVGGNWVANFSLGARSGTPAERESFGRAMDEGIIIVAAAGNQSAQSINYPAVYQGVLAISAIDSVNKMAEFSNYGRGIAFAAPGVKVLSTVPVGSVPVTALYTEAATKLQAVPLTGSAKGEVTGDTVYCGFGAPSDFPAGDITGKIALIRRSPPLAPNTPPCSLPGTCFRDKVRNAEARGAAAVVILPDDREDRAWTLFATQDDSGAKFPLVLAVVNLSDAEALVANSGRQRLTVAFSGEDYTYYNGTSMATPHVAGAAALVWSLVPTATADQVTLAMKMTAHDLGTPGYDNRFGYGRVDALAAAYYLAPGLFGVPPPPPPKLFKRRT